MFFRGAQYHVHEAAATVKKACPKCSNEVEFVLVWNKAGPGIGIPVISWFTDKTVITTHKVYHLVCPTCGFAERIGRDIAKGLIAEGRSA